MQVKNTSLPGEPRPGFDDILLSIAAVVPKRCEGLEQMISRTLSVASGCVQHYELLLIDSGSDSEVAVCIQELQTRIPHLRFIRLSRAYGREIAVAAALEHSVGDYVVILELGEDPPEVIPQMLARAVEGFDAVVAEPRLESTSRLQRWIANPVFGMVGRLIGFPLRPDESYFRLFSRRLVNSIIRIKSKHRYLACLNGMVGFRQSSLLYDRGERGRRNTFREMLKQLHTATDILVSNSAVPLRFASLLGFLASLANVAYLFYILIVTLVKKKLAEGWLTSSISQTMMFLMLFVIMSVLSEYIARILDETKEQPLYFVDFESNSTVSSTVTPPAAFGAAAGASSTSSFHDRLNIV